MGFGVAVGQHGDEQFFVVFIDAFPAFGKDGGPKRMANSDSRDFEIEVTEGEVEVSVVEAVSGVFKVIF
ncbi:hypothetical protein HNQ76_000350 [Thermosulfuriphilus ammonigenes]|nr:hypothetical protein [Thermosulfuriphilus ammonigenes]